MPLHHLQYREVFDRVQDIIYVRDLNGVILDINDAGARFFGRGKDELIGRKLHRRDDDAQGRSLKATNELLFEHGLDRSTVEMRNAAGAMRTVETTTTLMRDEAGNAIGAYGVMRDVTEAVELQRLMARDNARKTQELEEAHAIHLALLPKQVPRLPHVEIAVRMRNATEVGGDYYDFSVAPDGALTVALGDATGHGLKAGIFGATAKSYFHTLAGRATPRTMLETMSAAFRNLGLPALYMCLMLVRIHEREASIIGAGMPAFYLRTRSNEIERVEVAGTPLGVRGKPSFEGRVIDFDRGTTLLLFSDGLPELLDDNERELGEDAIRDCFAAAGDAPAEEVLARVLAMADAWSHGRAAEDDVTVMVLRGT
ncbi:MAG TPA: SpoIIE family protein phosphatase [Thermoanaerobaculia bacterium]|nr:SpoIIE family protein phosphatase [Thermoanaerobaculia bacterium]